MRAREFLVELAQSVVNSAGRPIARDPQVIKRFWAWFGKSKVKDRHGRPIVVYHGTQADFRSFDPAMSNSHTGTGVPDGAFVFTDNADVAVSYITADADRQGFPTQAETDEFARLIHSGSFEDQMNFLADHPTVPQPEYKPDGNLMPCYLRLLKPLVVNARGETWRSIYFSTNGEAPEDFTTNEIAAYAMENGHDGCIIRNVKDIHKGPMIQSTIYFVFSAGQIKSAIANNGGFGAGHEIDEDEECAIG